MEPTVAPHSIQLTDAAATRALGGVLLGWMQQAGQPVLLLRGELGAGKTSLVQGLAAALGIEEPITSPTFALAQHYMAPVGDAMGLVHLDLYRLEQPAAADELFEQEDDEARQLGALMAVEWPERLSTMPEGCWLLELELVDPSNPDAGRIATLHLL